MKTYQLNILIKDNEQNLQRNIELQADSTKELSQKLQIFSILSESLEHEDLRLAAELIVDKPKLIPVIKQLIEESADLNEAQLMFRIPGYVRRVIQVLK